MNSDLPGLSRTVDAGMLGRRIRQARLAAELTQAQVAGEDVSVALISRIEDGQRRPDYALLERMAARMRVSPEQLVLGKTSADLQDLRYELDHAELELASGNADQARTIADRVLAELEGADVWELRRAALQVRAGALEADGELSAAIAVLEELAGRPAADAAWLKSLIALSRCHRETGDLVRAIATGEEAAPLIEELGIEGLTEAIQLSVTVAGAYMVRGDLAHGRRICMKAIETADRYDSALGRASAYWNACLVEDVSGNPQAALDLARLAIAQFELGDDARNLGRLRAEIADLQLRVDPPDVMGALQTLDQADRELDWAPTSVSDLARQHLTRGEAHLLLGNHDLALEFLEASEDKAPEDATMLLAEIAVAKGQVAAAQGRVEDARRMYQSAAQTLAGTGADGRVSQLWFELGSVLADLNDTDASLDAFKRAAASMGLRSIRLTADR